MKLTNAMQDITTSVETALQSAGLLDGLSLTIDEIKSATEPIFWFVYVKSSEASEKQNYLVWNYRLINSISGDGKKLVYPFEVDITFYSRNKIVDTYLENIEDAFVAACYTIDLAAADYDTNRMMYSYRFVVRAQVSE